MDHTKFPPSLKSPSERIAKARELIENHLQVKTTEGGLAGFQGMWSETYIVTLENDQKMVVQFRAEPLDISPFQRAQKLLGDYCPTVALLHDRELEDATLYPVYMSYINGHSWCTDPKQATDPKFNVAVMGSLGRMLARCVIDEKDPNAVRNEVINKLDKRLASPRKEVNPFRKTIQELKERAATSELDKLPLFQSHMDLNDMNIMVTDEGEVTGIVDWELSPSYQPFGMGLHRIHDLAGQFENRVYSQRNEYEEMEQAFWHGILHALPMHHQKTINDNLEAVQLAVTIGTMLWAFDFDTGGEFINPAVLAALPKFLTYRIPALRGSEPAYDDSPSILVGFGKHKNRR